MPKAIKSFRASEFSYGNGWRLPSQLYPLVGVMGAIVGALGFSVAGIVDESLFTLLNGVGSVVVGSGVVTGTVGLVSHRNGKKHISKMTNQINATIIELTGDPSQCLNDTQVQAIMQRKSVAPLKINGVAGIEIKVVEMLREYSNNSDLATTVVYKDQDHGTSSFDHLVKAAAEKNPDIRNVMGSYRGRQLFE